jgi:hypothetical protein
MQKELLHSDKKWLSNSILKSVVFLLSVKVGVFMVPVIFEK